MVVTEEVLDAMTKEQRSLLLFLETQAVDRGGMVSGENMNVEDFQIARQWAADKFIRFSRIPTSLLAKGSTRNHVVELSEEAWACAGLERIRRAKRSQNKVVAQALEHFESQ